jgi:hypothetical protein
MEARFYWTRNFCQKRDDQSLFGTAASLPAWTMSERNGLPAAVTVELIALTLTDELQAMGQSLLADDGLHDVPVDRDRRFRRTSLNSKHQEDECNINVSDNKQR